MTCAAMPLLAACGSSQSDDSLPPLTPEPSLSLPVPQSTPPPASRSATRASYPARLVLMKFLRGVGAGEVRVCGYVSPSYARKAFAQAGGCTQWIGTAPTRLTPDQLDQLRTVQVLGATPGPSPGQYTIRARDLRWSTADAAPTEVLAKQYVLAKTGTGWLIVA
ncbi:MAG TPA: hypothetical protein VH912_12925 [Streptosporangiaceae bacterium]|jgi:hypothetical protein